MSEALHAYELSPEDAAAVKMLSAASFGPDAKVVLPSGREVSGAEMAKWANRPAIPEHRSANPVRRAVQDGFDRRVARGQLPAHERMASENVVLAAPMSFAGSTARIVNAVHKVEPGPLKTWAVIPLAALALLTIWAVVACWYLVFGVLLVPYRVVRRGQRRRELEALRHREILSATQTSRNAP